MRHSELHRAHRIGWLRAAVLGANDGIVSTSSLVIGVAAAHTDFHAILVSGTAGLVAGAMSMAAGEYVSVSSQVDTEQADLKREAQELADNHPHEVNELKAIYIDRGLEPLLAQQVAEQLMHHDALAAHARDELGLTEITTARPLQAALISALTFSLGALLPLVMVMIFPYLPLAHVNQLIIDVTASDTMPVIVTVGTVSLVSLMSLGGFSALVGGSAVYTAVARVTFWGMLSMGITAGVGLLFGVVSG
ncbi:Nodulin-related protein CC_0717 [Methylomonas albis]|uniref:VIT family protein n=1 Tax=Methylomonas albis TaxID=1854563 RepID=A0ABR9D6N2_9GAMM|nr:VIT family protein [Methylomonas albis]MBD9358752.1 VIT family protein [Methylomonas albis]CAD6882205.1 Nodulin-related protein CC_0717 [Methylomonas albis]